MYRDKAAQRPCSFMREGREKVRPVTAERLAWAMLGAARRD